MPREVQKNSKTGKRVYKILGSSVPLVTVVNTTRKHGKLTFKLPANLLEPKEIIKAKQKNKANTAKTRNEQAKKAVAEEAKRAEEGRRQFEEFLERARAAASKKRGSGARGSARRSTTRKGRTA